MSKANPALSQVRRLISELRADFHSLQQSAGLIKCRLSHRATNAEAEGVKGWSPFRSDAPPIMVTDAGSRDCYQRVDEKGNPRFIDPPVLTPDGKPITNSAGEGFDVVMPASRTVELWGDQQTIGQLCRFASRGGKLAETLVKSNQFGLLPLLTGWQFSEPEGLWWFLLFELAWSNNHPLLRASRSVWLIGSDGRLLLCPYDQQRFRALTKLDIGQIADVPPRWLERLPDAFLSEIDDLGAACVDCADLLLAELDDGTRSEEQNSGEITAVNQDDDAEDWVPYDEIKQLYGVGKGQLKKLADKNPKIRRDATSADRKRWNKPRLLWLYNKRRIYELTEGAAAR